MTFTPELFLSLLASAATAGGVYAAIRADLARLHEKAMSAHERIGRIESKVFT